MKLLDTKLKYLAAFAIAGGAQLMTTDKAFKQFTGLDVRIIDPSR